MATRNAFKFAVAWFGAGAISSFKYFLAENRGINNFIDSNRYKYDTNDEYTVNKVEELMRTCRNGMHVRFVAGPLMLFCHYNYAKNYISD